MAAAEIPTQPIPTLEELLTARKAERERERKVKEENEAERAERERASFERTVYDHISPELAEQLAIVVTHNGTAYGDSACKAMFTVDGEMWTIRHEYRYEHWSWELYRPGESGSDGLSGYRERLWDTTILDAIEGRREWAERQREAERLIALARNQESHEPEPTPPGPTNYGLMLLAMQHARQRGAEVAVVLGDSNIHRWRDATVDGYTEQAIIITASGAQRIIPWSRVDEIVLKPGPRVDEEVPF